LANKFWRLDKIWTSQASRRQAEWDHDEMESALEVIECPVNPGHQHAGKRLRNLSVVLPDNEVQDFVWTWYSECLLRDNTLALFRSAGFTGFETKPVAARFRSAKSAPPKLWELVVIGWAGMASPASGVRLDESKSCTICGHLTYTGLLHPDLLINEASWDGSDFFMVWPFPRFIFITERVARAIRSHNLRGARTVRGSDFNPVTDQFSPGRLSYLMPQQRARELGGPLGIY